MPPEGAAEQAASHHAKAGDILNTQDGMLGQTSAVNRQLP